MNIDVRESSSPEPVRRAGAVAPAGPPRRVTGQRVIRGMVVGLTVAALVIAGAGSSGAQGLSPDDRSADLPAARPGQFIQRSTLLPSRADAAAGEATVRAAMERDLDVSGAALDELLADSAAALALDAELHWQLGSSHAGSWFDRGSGTLVVAVTDRPAATVARAAGARTRLVARGEQELTAIVDALDARAATDPAAAAGMYSWAIDPMTNQVVVSVREGLAGSVAGRLAGYGDAVRVEESPAAPQPAIRLPNLDGGIGYESFVGGCSTGFNLRDNRGVGYVLTAGHCSNGPSGVGAATFRFGNPTDPDNPILSIGHFSDSFFPVGYDDALIRVTNSAYWRQGPWVWVYDGIITISDWTSVPVGFPVCKSGRTTGFTCGTVTAVNQTVNYQDGSGNIIGTVDRLVRHTACVEPGDSGGSNIMSLAGPILIQRLATGVTSGAALTSNRQCLAKSGGQNVSWFYPISDSLPYYNSVRFVNLLTG